MMGAVPAPSADHDVAIAEADRERREEAEGAGRSGSRPRRPARKAEQLSPWRPTQEVELVDGNDVAENTGDVERKSDDELILTEKAET